MAFPVPRTGLLQIGVPYREARANLGLTGANFQWRFFTSGSGFATPADVYTEPTLTTAFAPQGQVSADANGLFPKIYLKPSTVYGARLVNASIVTQRQYDPFQSSLANTGTAATNVATGLNVSTFNEYTLTNVGGGAGFGLTLVANQPAGIPLRISAPNPGAVALIINNSATTGAQTATFTSTTKPGAGAITVLLTVAPPPGAGYTGGTLVVAWPWATMTATATVTLSTGQVISGATLTNGSTTFTTPSTTITGLPNTGITVSTGIGPVAWLPLTIDGALMYTPLWRGDDFIPPFVTVPQVLGQTINLVSSNFISGGLVKFNGDGSSTISGDAGISITPSNWYLPNTTNIGSSYWINITKTGDAGAGNTFSAAVGAWTSITNSGIVISMTSVSESTSEVFGTYQLSSSAGGTPVVASGTITMGATNRVYGDNAGVGAGSGGTATETIPSGPYTSVIIEVWAGGGGGSATTPGGSNATSAGGGAGSYARRLYAVSVLGGAGKTFNVTWGAGGNGGSVGGSAATDGTASSVTAGTVTAFTTINTNPGLHGVPGTPGTAGAGGTAGTGGTTNTAGAPGTNGSGNHGGAPVAASNFTNQNTGAGTGGPGSPTSNNNGLPGSNGFVTFTYI